jgi:hypothetical protein
MAAKDPYKARRNCSRQDPQSEHTHRFQETNELITNKCAYDHMT